MVLVSFFDGFFALTADAMHRLREGALRFAYRLNWGVTMNFLRGRASIELDAPARERTITRRGDREN